jgi:hypothetical protein
MAEQSFEMTDFHIGDVLGRGSLILFKNIVPFGLLSLLFMSPQYIYALIIAP